MSSCDPDVAGEKITLPPMEFGFKVTPNTAIHRVGDTLTLHASISTKIGDGIILDDGQGEVWIYIGKSDTIPFISNSDLHTALNNIDYQLIVEGGGANFASDNPNYLFRLTSTPAGDSLIMSYKFVLLKPGAYRFDVNNSSFYEGSKGKARWSAKFDVGNPHWDSLWQVAGNPTPNPSEEYYYKNYLIAVTE